jgi:SAM-dependent methyltransferase
MSSVKEHYKGLLAENYTWMFGVSFEEKVAEQKALLEGHVHGGGFAIDLGSGPGFQAIALAELGFSPVLAIDSSPELLAELDAHKGSHRIETRVGDITELADDGRKAAVVVCMGDTLTHLPSKEAVRSMFAATAKMLAPGGRLVLTYRDLTSALADTDRFIPVRSEADRIMTCFLEYDRDDSVLVTDLVHLRGEAGWTLSKSSYRKLRLSQEWMREALAWAGFTSQTHSAAGRLSMVVASRP